MKGETRMTMTYASTFTGIGGFEIAFDRAGMRPTYMVEIDPHKRAVLDKHWPGVKKGCDVRDATGYELGRPDVVVGGFPCQHLSIGKAGRRGLAAEDSSGLYWEFHRLVGEHLRLVDSARPRWTILENVPGLVGFNAGRDLAAVLLGLEDLGYGWAYRVVDSRFLGSAQRRPRVIIVGHRGGDPRPAWDVLADRVAGVGNSGVRAEQAGGESGGTPGGARIFRKSSRPRASAAAGGYSTYREDGFFNTLTANDLRSPVMQTHIIVQDGRCRALTPLECERLQGFPDDWTQGMPEKDRFTALGEAMNVHTAEWLGRRLMQVNRSLPMLPERAA